MVGCSWLYCDLKMTDSFSLEETKSLARKLAADAKRGDCYCLTGDLGAGKTEFARAFIRELCGDITVASPTFNILQIYENKIPIYHFDLYRIKNEDELEEVGIEDALDNGITLIEWPQIAQNLLPDDRFEIHIDILDENKRKIIIK